MTTETTAIAEYSATETALADMAHRFKDVIFDVTTTKGDREARTARSELVTLRTTLEKKRKEIKEPALAHCQLIDSEAKRIKGAIAALEDPIDAQIKAEEDRREKERQAKIEAERERVAAIATRIASMREAPITAAHMTAAEVCKLMQDIDAIAIDDSFQEFQPDAVQAKDSALITLSNLYDGKSTAEELAARIKAEKEERERLDAEERERQRLANEVEAKRLAEERAKFEREQAETKAKREEEERIAAEQRKAEEQRLADERAELEAKQRIFDEAERQRKAAAEHAEKIRQDAAKTEPGTPLDAVGQEVANAAEASATVTHNSLSLDMWAEDAFASIDAGFFSADTFHSVEAIARAEHYLWRWIRQIESIKDLLKEVA